MILERDLDTASAALRGDIEPRRMGMCDNCHGDHHIQQCPQIAGFDLVAQLNEQTRTINQLRAQLDATHQHVGALVKASEDALGHMWQTRHGKVAHEALTLAARAARAWLRRAEPRGGDHDDKL